jgi:hypothetical protein
VLPVRHDDLHKRNTLFILHGVANNDESFDSCLPVRRDVVGLVQITLVDIGPGHESVDVDGMSALDLDRPKLLFVDFNILPLVSSSLVLGVNQASCLLVHHLLT